MRKLAVKEFLRFNPFRFNIYYLGGIIVAGIATAWLLSSGSVRKDHLPAEKTLNELPVNDNSKNITIPRKPAGEGKSDFNNKTTSKPVKNISVVKGETVGVKTIFHETDSGNKYVIVPGGVNESLRDKGLFTQTAKVNLKLKDRIKPEELLFESSVTEGCAPLTVLFHIKLTEYDSCQWTFGDGGSSRNRDAQWIYDVEGEYKVVLKAYGPEGMIASSESVISVFPKPTARFEISPERAVLPDDEIRFQNYSATAVKYLWNFGDGSSSEQFEPLHRYEKYGNYNVSIKVYSEYGCSDSLIVFNAFSGSAYYIEFPNAFIPNPAGPSGGVYSSKIDESAQVFHPSFSGVSEYQLKIFSKLGILLFETNDINIGWDGYFKSQLSNPGVYIWKVRGNFSNGEPFTKMGDVTLLKN